MNETQASSDFSQALQLLQRGAAAEARELLERIVAAYPGHAPSLYLLGVSHYCLGDKAAAVAAYQQAIAVQPDYAEAYGNLGLALTDLKRHEEAVAAYRQAVITAEPDQAEIYKTYNNLGNALRQVKRQTQAVAAYQQAISLKPDFAEAHSNLGNALNDLKRHEEAVAAYQQAIKFKPDYAEAYSNLGVALNKLNRHEEAVAAYRQAVMLKPDQVEAYSNLGVALSKLKRHDESVAACRQAITLKPDFAAAYNNLGSALTDLKRHAEAVACFTKAVSLNPDFSVAYNNLGFALTDMNRHAEAIACFAKVLSIEPDYPFASGTRLYGQMHICDWERINEAFQELLVGIDAGKAVSNPFPILAMPSSPAQQKRCAETYIREKFPAVPASSSVGGRYPHDKIRLGYFSADFHNHATAYLMAELIERHDRSRFEVIGFSYGASPNDGMRQRLSAAFDRLLDVRNQPDQDIAALARNLEIDIAVDLKGLTGDSRTGIFSLRPAPIQVNYLGYPGTMGASYIDYLIADPTLIPVEHRQHYTEKIAYLPDTYQVNDTRRRISERPFTRSEAGLPGEGFVFCCFNNSYKITPSVFDIWMEILQQIEGSVLWLLEGNADATRNLHKEAKKRGIAPERIVFAQRMDLPEHLARHRLADLFLDTFPYNAHTTASDALWTGLPVLTCLGQTFAGKVAASLLNAMGLPDLITSSHAAYKTLALDLARHPEKLASIRRQLARNRITHPLFNTALFTQHIEDAFIQMWQRHQASLAPDHIYAGTTA